MRFINLIKKAEFISPGPTLKMQRKENFGNVVGGIFCIILIIMSLIGTTYFSNKLLNKQDPIVFSSERVENNATSISMGNKDDMIILLGIEFPNFTYYKDPRIYTVDVTFSIMNIIDGEQHFESKTIEVDSCTKYYNSTKEIDFYFDIDLDIFYCIKPNEATISGYFDSNFFTYLEINLKVCRNTTENSHCLSNEDISFYLENGIISLYITDHLIDIKNYNNPISKYYTDDWNRISLKLKQQINILPNRVEFLTDSGFLLEDFSSHITYKLSPNRFIYIGREEADDSFASVYMENTKYGTKYVRYYIKVQDVITKIGGRIKALMIVAQFITSYYSNWEYYYNLIKTTKKLINS